MNGKIIAHVGFLYISVPGLMRFICLAAFAGKRTALVFRPCHYIAFAACGKGRAVVRHPLFALLVERGQIASRGCHGEPRCPTGVCGRSSHAPLDGNA